MEKSLEEELITKVAEALLQERGEALMADPMGADLEILRALRRVGEGATSKVFEELSSRLVEEEKKDRG